MSKKLPVIDQKNKIMDAMTEHRGDLFLAAQQLEMTPLQLDKQIRKSAEMLSQSKDELLALREELSSHHTHQQFYVV